MKSIPTVAIVGRMNVGKSTLFNRLSKNVKSITFDHAGVTRDVIKDEVVWLGRSFELIDTGGITILDAASDPLAERVRGLALATIEEADLVLFVVDGTQGIVPEDREIADVLRRLNKKTILVVNKDDVKKAEEHRLDFYELYHDELLAISAEHGLGIQSLLEKILELLPEKGTKLSAKPSYRVVFLGRPNVGKSSLLNLLLDQERSLVSDIPGTTREAISEQISFYQENIHITDTPGIRRKSSIHEDLEGLMVKSSFGALTDADIVVLLIDATQDALVDQELKLAFYAFQERYKALIVVVNKTDLMDEEMTAVLERRLDEYKHLVKKIEILRISCKTGKNVGKLLPLIKKVWQRYSQELPASELQNSLLHALRKTPLVRAKQELAVYKVRQLATAPITVGLAVNHPQWFEQSQKAFFENVMRKEYDLKGVPVKFIVRKKL